MTRDLSRAVDVRYDRRLTNNSNPRSITFLDLGTSRGYKKMHLQIVEERLGRERDFHLDKKKTFSLTTKRHRNTETFVRKFIPGKRREPGVDRWWLCWVCGRRRPTGGGGGEKGGARKGYPVETSFAYLAHNTIGKHRVVVRGRSSCG